MEICLGEPKAGNSKLNFVYVKIAYRKLNTDKH